MAPRPSDQLLPTQRLSPYADPDEEEGPHDGSADPEVEDVELHDDEAVTLQVLRGRRRVLETVVDAATTVSQLKEQVERSTGIPGERQVIACRGRPLSNAVVLRSCVHHLVSTVTLREADQSWVQALQALQVQEEGQSCPDLPSLQSQSAQVLKEVQRLTQLLRQQASDLICKFKETTSSLVSSANKLEDAAERLQRNRAVIFEVAPRGSKGARRAAEDLMQCRSALLEATQQNGEVLADRGLSLSAVHEAFSEQLLELRRQVVGAQELLLRRTELLHIHRHRGSLCNATVEAEEERCQEQLSLLRANDLQGLSQDVVACRRNYKVAMKSNLLAIKRVSEYLQQDEKVVLTWALNHVSKGRASDRDFMLAVVQSNGEALEEAPLELRQDREVVLEALRSSKGWALQFASDELKQDREIVLTAVRRSGLCLEFAAEEMQADRDVVLAAVQVHGEALEFASQELRQDPVVVEEAIRTSCGWALQYASEELRDNPHTVLRALRANGLVLEHVSTKLQGDEKMALVAVTSNPAALQFASEKLRGNKKLVLAAVGKDGFALRFATDAMQADRDVVLAALQQAGEYVLVFAPGSLRHDPQIAEVVSKLEESAPTSEGFVDVSWAETGMEKANL